MGALDRLRDLVFPGSQARPDPLWFGAHSDMLGRYQLYDKYVSGDVFRILADPEAGVDGGYKYPLKLNLCREWANMMSGYLYGQYDDVVITHQVRRKTHGDGVATEEEKRAKSMESVLLEQWQLNNNDSLAMTAAMDAAVYGGVVVKTVYDSVDNAVRDEWLAPDIFLPRWHPTDVNRLLEVYQAYEIARDDARDVYNLSEAQWSKLPEAVLVWERWTKDKWELFVDDIRIRDTDKNQFGFIPYTYIPWDRASAVNHGYYGISTLEDMMGVQNELNERMADLGDGVSYSSHPIRVLRNVTNKGDLSVGPDALWDLGMGFGNKQPDAFTLDTSTNYGDAMKFMSVLEKYGRESVGLPPIAFGEDEGSQRSGTTLLIRFLPLTQQIRRARLYWRAGLAQRAKFVLDLSARFGDKDGVQYKPSDLKGRIINPDLAPILPKDVSDKVDEWSVRISAGFGTPEEAYADLGHPEPDKAADKALEYMERVAKSESITRGLQNVGGNSGKGTGDSSGAGSGSGQAKKSAQESGKQSRVKRNKD